MTKPKCIVCGGRANLLCDSWLGWERMRGKMRAEAPNLVLLESHNVPLRYRTVHTCDAPLCSACSVPAGTAFFRLRNRGSFQESIDYCPGHGRGERSREITGLEAEAMRKVWRGRFAHGRKTVDHQMDLFAGLGPRDY